jgi:hypothetical protein
MFSCQLDVSNDMENSTTATKALVSSDVSPSKLIKDTGVIKYINLEGGFYGIIGKNGNYDPVNLPRLFQQDGLRVEFTAELVTDMASIHMWGKIIRLVAMQTTDSEKKLIMDQGTIDQVFIQGSPWLIRGTLDTYQPINLPSEYQVENLKVSVVGVIRKDIVIIPALWPILEIVEIKKIGQDPIIVSLNREFKLPETQSALVPKDQFLLTFNSVLQDSRCPIGVECFWQGEAVIEVNVKIGSRDYGNFKMSTLGNPSIIRVGTYIVRFIDLYPYPVYSMQIKRPDYVGYFMISRVIFSDPVSIQ